MQNTRLLEFQIRCQGYEPEKGAIQVGLNQSLSAIKDRIEKQHGYQPDTLTIQQPTRQYMTSSTKLIVLREARSSPSRTRKPSLEGSSIIFEEESIIERPENQREFIYKEPQVPPKVIGTVKKSYKFFSCFSSTLVMALSFDAVRFYASYEREQENDPDREIKLEEIKEICSYRKQVLYFMRIVMISGQQIDLRFTNKQVCKEWISYLNNALDYSQFLNEKKNYCKPESFKKMIRTLSQREQKFKVVKLEDSTQVSIGYRESSANYKQKCQSSTLLKSSKEITRLADFKVTHQIGRGAFAVVYRAERNGKVFALKQISKDKLLYENQVKYAMTQLNILKKGGQQCPFIVPLYYAFQTQDYLYFVLKYLPYGTLKNVIQKRTTLPIKQAIAIICELIIAIEFLHRNNIIYRDLKPENIMMTKQGHIYLIDFGLSIELTQDQIFAQSFVGTPLYLAPERLTGTGKVNYKADIYGVGCIFYLMLHGKAPYEADTLDSIRFNILHTDLEISPKLDDLVQDFLKQTLQKNAQKRIQRMSQHPLFEGVNWHKIAKRGSTIMKLEARQSSQYCGPMGTGDKDYTEQNFPNKKFSSWNYISPNQSI